MTHQLKLEDIEESPQSSETSAETSDAKDQIKPVSAYYPVNMQNSLRASNNGRKVYESSYPKISAWYYSLFLLTHSIKSNVRFS